MFDSIGKMLGTVKDKALEASARAFLNNKFAEFGNVTFLAVDTRLRKASLTAELKGESAPISVEIGSYEIVELNGQMCIRVLKVSASREWLALAMKRYLVGRLVPLPPSVMPFLK
jgi:hypothetical protein